MAAPYLQPEVERRPLAEHAAEHPRLMARHFVVVAIQRSEAGGALLDRPNGGAEINRRLVDHIEPTHRCSARRPTAAPGEGLFRSGAPSARDSLRARDAASCRSPSGD